MLISGSVVVLFSGLGGGGRGGGADRLWLSAPPTGSPVRCFLGGGGGGGRLLAVPDLVGDGDGGGGGGGEDVPLAWACAAALASAVDSRVGRYCRTTACMRAACPLVNPVMHASSE